jgi:hypothetical protein
MGLGNLDGAELSADFSPWPETTAEELRRPTNLDDLA